MPTISVAIDIAAPQGVVFEAFSDLNACPDRIRGIDSIQILSDGPMQMGTRWRETRTMFGKEATEEMWVTAFDAPLGYTVEAESHGTHYTSTYRFSETDQGTRVDMSFEGQPLTWGAKLMAIPGQLFMGSLRKMLLADMEDLKQHCEAHSPS